MALSERVVVRLPERDPRELVRPEVRELAARGEVTWEEYDQPMNSHEREILYPALTDAALRRVIEERILPQCSMGRRKPAVSYEDAVIGIFLPEVLRRWEGGR